MEVLTLSALPPSPERCYRHAERTRHARKSGPSRGIATGSPVGVCHVPMKRVRLERTPKPTNPYSNALQVPEKITCYQDIADFLNQFPQSEYYKPVTESEGLPA